MQHMQLVKDDGPVTLRDPILIQGSTLTFTCKEEKCRAVAILASEGIFRVSSQLFSKDLKLEFADEDEALSIVDTYLNRGRELSETLLKAMFDESLEDEYGQTSLVCGYGFRSSHALLALDPTLYQELFVDWLDHMLDDGRFIETNGKYFERTLVSPLREEEE